MKNLIGAGLLLAALLAACAGPADVQPGISSGGKPMITVYKQPT